MASPMRTPLVLVTSLALLGTGCGVVTASGAFNARFPDNEPGPTRRVVEALPDPVVPAHDHDANIAVGTTEGEQREVVAFELDTGRKLWSTPLQAMTRPAALGDVVVTATRDQVVGLDLGSGRILWRRPTEGLAYVGATRSGNTIVYVGNVGAAGGEVRESHLVAVDARGGGRKWDHRISAVLGHPATQGPYVFLPWDRQNIAVLEVSTGNEVARLRTEDDIIDWIVSTPAGLFYGSRGIYRLTENSYHGTREEAVYREPPIPEAPRTPLVEEDGFSPEPGMRSARGKIRIYWEPRPGEGAFGEPIAVAGDTFYYVYFRYVFAFDGEHRLRWAHMLPDTVLAAQALDGGLLVITEGGAARVLGLADGSEVWAQELETELASLSIHAAGFEPAGVAVPDLPAVAPAEQAAPEVDPSESLEAEGEDGEPAPEEPVLAARDPSPEGTSLIENTIVAPGADAEVLRQSLIRIATDPDNRLVPGRGFAIALLAGIHLPEVTRDLLDLYAQRSMPSALRNEIVEALRTRSEGASYLVAALDQRYDFLEDTRSPPLALIVPSLIESGHTEAVPGLAAQLEDHETPLEVLPLLVEGVATLGGEAAQPTIRRFLTFYRSDSTFEDDPRALLEATDAVFENPGEDGRAYLEKIAASESTLAPVREHITGLFQAEAERAANAGFEEVLEAARETDEIDKSRGDSLPEKLTQAQIQAEFASNADILRDCIVEEIERDPKLGQVRFVFIIDDDGVPHDYAITPASDPFINCVEPVVRDFRYPEVKQKRTFATVTLRIGSGTDAGAAEDELGCGENDPWWTCYRAVDSGGRPLELSVASDAQPWWSARPAPEWYVSEGERRRRAVEALSRTSECPPTDPNCNEDARVGTTPEPTETPTEGGGEEGGGEETGEPAEETPWWLDAAGGGEGGAEGGDGE